MFTISMPVYRRPEYLRKSLDSIRSNKDHVDWTLVISVENGAIPEVMAMVDGISFMDKRIFHCPTKMGLDNNTNRAFNLAWKQGSDANLYLEDDIVLSKDALLLCSSFFNRGRSRGYQTQEELLGLGQEFVCKDETRPKAIKTQPRVVGLLGNGFFCAFHMQDFFNRHWFDGRTWDLNLHCALQEEGKHIDIWRPLIPRSTQIGFHGEHCQGVSNDMNLFGPCYRGCETEFVFEP